MPGLCCCGVVPILVLVFVRDVGAVLVVVPTPSHSIDLRMVVLIVPRDVSMNETCIHRGFWGFRTHACEPLRHNDGVMVLLQSHPHAIRIVVRLENYGQPDVRVSVHTK